MTDYKPPASRSLPDLPGMEIVPLQVRGKCKLEQLIKCLGAMQKSETLIIVDWFSLTNDEKKPGELELIMMVSTLAVKEKEKS